MNNLQNKESVLKHTFSYITFLNWFVHFSSLCLPKYVRFDYCSPKSVATDFITLFWTLNETNSNISIYLDIVNPADKIPADRVASWYLCIWEHHCSLILWNHKKVQWPSPLPLKGYFHTPSNLQPVLYNVLWFLSPICRCHSQSFWSTMPFSPSDRSNFYDSSEIDIQPPASEEHSMQSGIEYISGSLETICNERNKYWNESPLSNKKNDAYTSKMIWTDVCPWSQQLHFTGVEELPDFVLTMTYYRLPKKFREGNIFSHVCPSVFLSAKGVPMWPLPMMHCTDPPMSNLGRTHC